MAGSHGARRVLSFVDDVTERKQPEDGIARRRCCTCRFSPCDTIKIDATFISNLHRNQQSAGDRGPCHRSRPRAQRANRRRRRGDQRATGLPGARGCNGVQGYLIGKPQAIDAYAEIVGRSPPANASGVWLVSADAGGLTPCGIDHLGKAGRRGAELSRRSTDVVAFLSKSDDELPLGTCLIIDISEDAARLRIEKPADVPDQSVLLLSPRGRSFRRCRVIPGSMAEAGVQFTK